MEIKIGLEIELNKYGKVKVMKKDKNDCFYVENKYDGFWLSNGEVLDLIKEDGSKSKD